MSPLTLSRIWTGSGLFMLAGLWCALLWAPQWLGRMGWLFLATPMVLAAVTVWRHGGRDRLTMLCLAALTLLFLIAWYI